MTVEASRLFVLEQLDRHRRIPFSPRPAPVTSAPARSRARKRTAKLNPEKVRDIRQALAAGEPIAHIAARHGVTKVAIEHIESGRSWGDVR